MTKQEFIQNIKNKYPEYKDTEGNQLYDSIITKYPQYESQISSDPIKTEEVKPKEPGFFSKVATDLKKRGQSIVNTFKDTFSGEINPLETGIQTVGALAGGVADVGMEIFNQGIKPQVEGLKRISEGIDMVAPGAQSKLKEQIISNPVVKYGLELAQQGVGAYEGWKSSNPNAAKNLESVVNIATIFPASEGIEIGAKNVAKDLGKVASKSSKLLDAGIEKGLLDDALKVISPQLSRAEKTAAIAEGRGESQGLLKKFVLRASEQDLEIAQTVKDIVNPKLDDFTNISKIESKIVNTALDLEESFRKLPEQGFSYTYNTSEFENFLSKVKKESKVIFGSDKSLESRYDAVVQQMMDLVQERPAILANIWNSRKEFDNIIKDKFGANILSNPVGDNAVKNAIRDVRTAANDFIASKLPQESIYQKPLKDMSLMYKGINNISKKAASKIDSNMIERAVKAIKVHPMISGGAALGLTAGLSSGGLIAILSSPLLLGTLMTYGTIKLGKNIITSKTLRTALSDFLKSTANVLGTKEKKAIQEILRNLEPVQEVKLLGAPPIQLGEFSPSTIRQQIQDVGPRNQEEAIKRLGEIQGEQAPSIYNTKTKRRERNPAYFDKSQLPKAKAVTSAEQKVTQEGTESMTVYHGTSLENANKISTDGFKAGGGKGVSGGASSDFVYVTKNKASANRYVSDRLGIKNPTTVEGSFSGKVLEVQGIKADFEAFGEVSKKLGVPLGVDSQGNLSMLDMPAIKKAMKEQGYGAIQFSDRYANGTKALAVLPENIKTKSPKPIFKPASKADDVLIKEAKKYKTANEFISEVGAKGLDDTKLTRGMEISSDRFFGKNSNIEYGNRTDSPIGEKSVKFFEDKIKSGERPIVQIVENVKRFGKKYLVSDGNHTLKAYENLGEKKIPIYDWTEGRGIKKELTDIWNKAHK